MKDAKILEEEAIFKIFNFKSTGNDPCSWIHSAASLLASARVLRRNRESIKDCFSELVLKDMPFPDESFTEYVELMLISFAFENFLKSLWIQRGKKLVVDGSFRDINSCRSHDLECFAEKVGINLGNIEKDALKKLHFYATAYGRYPISKSWNKPKDLEVDDGVLKNLLKKIKVSLIQKTKTYSSYLEIFIFKFAVLAFF